MLPLKFRLDGELVRLKPPSDASDARLAELTAAFRDAGAVAVQVDARKRQDEAPRARQAAPERVASVRDLIRHAAEQIAPNDPGVLAECMRALDQGEQTAKRGVVPSSSTPLSISRIEAKNWVRFPEIDIALSPGAYAVTSEHEKDPERSNYGGKSSLLTTIPYALMGWHLADHDEGWIRRDTDYGFVRLTLSDGSAIHREKKRGSSTKLHFVCGGKEAVQAEAQAAIIDHIGLSENDYFATVHARQKELSRLVSGTASKTMQIVASWLDLAPIKAAHQSVVVALDLKSALEFQIMTGEKDAERILKEALGDLTDAGDLATSIEAEITKANEHGCELDVLRSRMRKAESSHEAAKEATKRLAVNGERERKRTAAKNELLALVEPEYPSEEQALEIRKRAVHVSQIRDELREAKQAVETKRRVSLGLFDGACPVAGIACPAKDQINSDREPSRRALKIAEAAHDVAKKTEDLATAELTELRYNYEKKQRAVDAYEHRRQSLESTLAVNAPLPVLTATSEAEPLATLAEQITVLSVLMNEHRHSIDALRKRQAIAVEQRTRLDDLHRRHDALQDHVRELRLAARILGPAGIQKQWATSELMAIEDGANEFLASVADDLRVKVRWGHESPTALAHACVACGFGFPATSRAKTCSRCAAVRGPKIEEEIYIGLSNVSGAAEDLAGVAVQAAASRYLADRRGSAWRVLVLDEPVASLDPSLRKSMSSKLVGMLGRFEQSFVTAHDAAVLERMPRRILIEAKSDGTSSVRVEE